MLIVCSRALNSLVASLDESTKLVKSLSSFNQSKCESTLQRGQSSRAAVFASVPVKTFKGPSSRRNGH